MGKRVKQGARGWYFTPKTYDFLNNIFIFVFPALGVFYASIAALWNLGYVEQIVGTLSALTILLKVILLVSRKYWLDDEGNMDGVIVVNTDDPMKDTLSINLDNMMPLDIIDRKTILLKVDNQSSR